MQSVSDRKQSIQRAFEKSIVSFAYLFGSQASSGLAYLDGKDVRVDDPLADLDIGVKLEHYDELTPLERAHFYADLHNELQVLFSPFTVDLILLDETHSVFQSEAITGHCIYAHSQEERDAYEIWVLTRAADFRPFLDAFYRERLEDI